MRVAISLALVLLNVLCSTREIPDRLDRYIITCHTSDFTCFKRQYRHMRDKILLGSERYAIPAFTPLAFHYGDTGTCVKISGWDSSELVGIGMDSETSELTLILELPLRIQQVKNDTIDCSRPQLGFHKMGIYNGTLRKFTGNATVEVTYPYQLRQKKGDTYMMINSESVDVIMDIPEYKFYNQTTQNETTIRDEVADWAYDAVQHIDVAEDFALPYTGRYRSVTDRLPLHRLLLLYPEEEYSELQFRYHEKNTFALYL